MFVVAMYYLRKLRARLRWHFKKMYLARYDNISFAEWESLRGKTKGAIINIRWSFWPEPVGEGTRNAIIDAFRDRYPDLCTKALMVGIDVFGWGATMLYVLVPDSSIRVPGKFGDLPVNKGVLRKRVDEDNLIVDWGYAGKNSPFRISAHSGWRNESLLGS